ncbi:hypothetical protein GF356_08120 [candidate division GN15 bacterium]|nr:hypothetical protein [candidate division GN15 bacterium]
MAGLIVLAVLAIASGVVAGNYVSYAGEFFIAYPDDWVQMDYLTVDGFLQRSGAADRAFYDYEAVFAHEDNSPFFAGPYLILRLDTTGAYTEKMIDSVAFELGREYSTQPVDATFDEFWRNMAFKVPYIDRENNLLGIKVATGPPKEGQKYNVILAKYYDKGAANFFFFAPREQYQQSLDAFEAIFTSFSTENWESANAPESLRVANIDTVADTDDNSGGNRTLLWVLVAIALILVVIFRVYMVRKRSSKQI